MGGSKPPGGGSPAPSPSGGALELRARVDGTLLRVRVTPKASRNEVLGVAEGVLRLRIQAPPVEGAANEAARAFLAGLLGRPKSSVTLERGAANRDKVFHVAGLEPSAVAAALAGRLAGIR